MIQKFAEVFQYAELLNKAAVEQNQFKRLAYIAAFCVAGYNINTNRTTKFFNPILGETYELIDNELEFRYFGEQVSHHPPISAIHVDGKGYTFESNTNAKSRFEILQNALIFEPIGKTFIKLNEFEETISFSKPEAIVRGIMVGTMSLDIGGKAVIINHNNGDQIELTFYPKDQPKQNDLGVVFGHLVDMFGEKKLEIKGNWLNQISITYQDDLKNDITETIWKTNLTHDTPDNLVKKYYFSDYAINLNNDNPDLLKTLPITDSRLRPDQRALEQQNIDLGSKEKLRLEEKQRARRREYEKKKKIYKPLYFTDTYDNITGELVYTYTGDYWGDKSCGKMDHFADIYSTTPYYN